MKYTLGDNDTDEVSFEVDSQGNVVVEFPEGGSVRIFDEAKFKEFRKAVGYVWQEVPSDGE